MDSYDKYKKT